MHNWLPFSCQLHVLPRVGSYSPESTVSPTWQPLATSPDQAVSFLWEGCQVPAEGDPPAALRQLEVSDFSSLRYTKARLGHAGCHWALGFCREVS